MGADNSKQINNKNHHPQQQHPNDDSNSSWDVIENSNYQWNTNTERDDDDLIRNTNPSSNYPNDLLYAQSNTNNNISCNNGSGGGCNYSVHSRTETEASCSDSSAIMTPQSPPGRGRTGPISSRGGGGGFGSHLRLLGSHRSTSSRSKSPISRQRRGGGRVGGGNESGGNDADAAAGHGHCHASVDNNNYNPNHNSWHGATANMSNKYLLQNLNNNSNNNGNSKQKQASHPLSDIATPTSGPSKNELVRHIFNRDWRAASDRLNHHRREAHATIRVRVGDESGGVVDGGGVLGNDHDDEDSKKKKKKQRAVAQLVTPLHLAAAFDAPPFFLERLIVAAGGEDALTVGTAHCFLSETGTDNSEGVIGARKFSQQQQQQQHQQQQQQQHQHQHHQPHHPMIPSTSTNSTLPSAISSCTASTCSATSSSYQHSNKHQYNPSKHPSNNKQQKQQQQPLVIEPDPASDGWLPIHVALLYHAAPSTLEALLAANPRAALQKNGMGMLPLHIACSGMKAPPLLYGMGNDGGDESDNGGKMIGEVWNVVEAIHLLLRAFPGAVHVPCSRNGVMMKKNGNLCEDTGGGLTPGQYAARHLRGRERAAVEELLNRSGRRFEPFPSTKVGADPSSLRSHGEIMDGVGCGDFDVLVQNFATDGPTGDLHTAGRQRRRGSACSSVKQRTSKLHRLAQLLTRSTAHSPVGINIHSNNNNPAKMSALEDGKPTKLYDLVATRDWKSIEARAKKRPEEAGVWTLIGGGNGGGRLGNQSHHRHRRRSSAPAGGSTTSMDIIDMSPIGSASDPCHRLPLHLACSLKPPSSTIRALIRAHPEGAHCREKYGMLPLHVACQKGASASVIQALVDEHPDAAGEMDSFGLLPLHLACTEGASQAVIKTLLRAHPWGADVADSKGKKPCDYAADSLHPNKNDALMELDRGLEYWLGPSVKDNPDDVPELYGMLIRHDWKGVAGRLKRDHRSEASVWVEDPDSKWSGRCCPRLPLHVACRRRAPEAIIRSLLSAFPEAASSRGGKHDLLPLHVACQSGCRSGVIVALLEAYPEGARAPDEFGLLPLHLAVTEDAEPTVLEVLLRAYPPSARIEDRRGNHPLAYARASYSPHRVEYIVLLETDPRVWETPPPEDLSKLALNDLIDQKEWELAEERVKKYPAEASSAWFDEEDVEEMKSEGSVTERMPIHGACALGAPRSLVSAILKAYPFSAECKADDGGLPLHTACSNKASLEVIEELIGVFPSAVSRRDAKGRLPLHRACMEGTTATIIETLLRAFPQSVTEMDGRGRSALLIVERSYHKNKTSLIDVLERRMGIIPGGRTIPPTPPSTLSSLYNMVCTSRWSEVVDRCATHPAEAAIWCMEVGYNHGRLPLHRAYVSHPPIDAVAALIVSYPDAARMRERDGRLPLHLACQYGASLETVKLLIEVEPSAISTRDRHGFLPIHVACSEGASVEVVKALLRASPSSFAARDKRGWTALDYAELTHPDGDAIVDEVEDEKRRSLVAVGADAVYRSVPSRLTSSAKDLGVGGGLVSNLSNGANVGKYQSEKIQNIVMGGSKAQRDINAFGMSKSKSARVVRSEVEKGNSTSIGVTSPILTH